MSYVNVIREQVLEAQEKEVEAFKVYMEDYCIQQFKDSMSVPTAVLYKNDIVDEGLNVNTFVHWAEDEGFEVNISNNNITISYLPEEDKLNA